MPAPGRGRPQRSVVGKGWKDGGTGWERRPGAPPSHLPPANAILKKRRDVNFPAKKMRFDTTPNMWLPTSGKTFAVKIEKLGI